MRRRHGGEGTGSLFGASVRVYDLDSTGHSDRSIRTTSGPGVEGRRFLGFSAGRASQPSGPTHSDPVKTDPEVRLLPGLSQADPFVPLEPHPRPPRPPGVEIAPDESLAAHGAFREERGAGPLGAPGCVLRGISPLRLRLAP